MKSIKHLYYDELADLRETTESFNNRFWQIDGATNRQEEETADQRIMTVNSSIRSEVDSLITILKRKIEKLEKL